MWSELTLTIARMASGLKLKLKSPSSSGTVTATATTATVLPFSAIHRIIDLLPLGPSGVAHSMQMYYSVSSHVKAKVNSYSSKTALVVEVDDETSLEARGADISTQPNRREVYIVDLSTEGWSAMEKNCASWYGRLGYIGGEGGGRGTSVVSMEDCLRKFTVRVLCVCACVHRTLLSLSSFLSFNFLPVPSYSLDCDTRASLLKLSSLSLLFFLFSFSPLLFSFSPLLFSFTPPLPPPLLSPPPNSTHRPIAIYLSNSIYIYLPHVAPHTSHLYFTRADDRKAGRIQHLALQKVCRSWRRATSRGRKNTDGTS